MMDRLHIIKKQEDNQHHLDEGSILMAEPAATANTLPAEIQAGLDRFRDEMETALGPELVALMVYGDVLCRDVNRSRLDGVNVMVVLRQVRLADLDKIMKPVKAAGKKIGLVPMVVSETDIKGSADVFPIKFLQIKHHHKLLYGTDVFQGMEVSKAHLRLRCEQELKNLMLRTRPRARAEQWSEGRRDYKPEGQQYLGGDFILKLTVHPEPGYAVKELYFTRKENTLPTFDPNELALTDHAAHVFRLEGAL